MIFITEHDIFKCGLPLYHIDRIIKENNMTFQDESHIIYVNGEYEGNDPIGDLMHDFACANPDKMRSKILAEKTRYYKQDDKGVRRMSKIMEEFAIEERTEAKLEAARNMLSMNLGTHEQIAQAVELSLETVQQLAEELKAETVLQ
ncbi:MAG: hypothetical protein J6X78_01900 [Treponema sp.]|nr:hypothetical protein [Treponema sp.]